MKEKPLKIKLNLTSLIIIINLKNPTMNYSEDNPK